jgi:four helix bundle protein
MEEKSMMAFEDLDVWKQARTLVNATYTLTRRESLARDFGLCGQLQPAAASVMTNVAEGFERVHLPEKLQFYNVARGSTGEVRSLLYVVSDNFRERRPKLCGPTQPVWESL